MWTHTVLRLENLRGGWGDLSNYHRGGHSPGKQEKSGESVFDEKVWKIHEKLSKSGKIILIWQSKMS